MGEAAIVARRRVGRVLAALVLLPGSVLLLASGPLGAVSPPPGAADDQPPPTVAEQTPLPQSDAESQEEWAEQVEEQRKALEAEALLPAGPEDVNNPEPVVTAPAAVSVDGGQVPPEVAEVVASVSTVDLAAPVSAARSDSGSGSILTVAAPRSAARSAVPSGSQLVSVQVLGDEVAGGLGGKVAFSVDAVDVAARGTTAEVTIDYSSFIKAFGGDWATRLEVRQYPACVLTTPAEAGCSAYTVVPSSNDVHAHTISTAVAVAAAGKLGESDLDGAGAQMPPAETSAKSTGAEPTAVDAAGGASPVFLLAGATGGAGGDFSASPLAPASSWSAGSGSGSFDWSYEVPLVPAPHGSAPSIGVHYSSGSVDGMSIATNNQPGVAGLGWDLSMGFIERRYMPCNDPKEGGTVADQCWVSDNATITFGGRSSELVEVTDHNPPRNTPPGATEWRLEIDPRWRVLRWADASNGDDGDAGNAGEWWQVFLPDGTVASFGQGEITASGTTFDHQSALTVPVVGNHSGEPCHAKNSEHWCQQAWRWMVDTVSDSNGNTQQFFWQKEQNRYQTLGGAIAPQSYDMAARLVRVEYGETASDQWTTTDVGVDLEYGFRCIQLDACVAPNPDGSGTWVPNPPNGGNGAEYPDVPNDLICTSTTSCDDRSPSFFTAYRLRSATTWVRENDVYSYANRVQFTHDWTCTPYSQNQAICGRPRTAAELPVPPGEPADMPVDDLATKLWLREIQRIGSPTLNVTDPANPFFEWAPEAVMPPIRFDAVKTHSTDWTGQEMDGMAFPNRADFRNQSEYQMLMYRITQIRDELGGVVQVTYGQPHGCIGMDPEHPDAAQSLPASGFVDNVSNCYPIWTTAAAPGDDPGTPHGPPGWALFNKYVVTLTRVLDMTPDGGTFTDPTGQAVTSTTRYDYGWGINDAGEQVTGWGYSDVTWVPRNRNWNVWRGYSEVTVRVGNDNDTPITTRHRYLRGMHGDYIPTWHAGYPNRDVYYDRIATEPNGGPPGFEGKLADEEWFAGYERETRNLRAFAPGESALVFTDGTDETSTVSLPSAVETANTGTGISRAVYTQQSSTFTQPAATMQQRAFDGYVSQTTTATTYDTEGYPDTVTTSGTDIATTCTKYSYARNQAHPTWILDRVRSELTFPDICPASGTTGVIKDTYRYYDNHNDDPGWSTPPTNGNVTWVRVGTGDPDPNRAYLGTVTTYDAFGRVSGVRNPRGYWTYTYYSASSATGCGSVWVAAGPGPVRKVKTVNAKSWASCDTLEPRTGAPIEKLDVRGYITTLSYDGLGRLAKVWLPDNALTSNPPSYEFTYAVDAPDYSGLDPSIPLPIPGHTVTTLQLQQKAPTAVNLASYAIVDSLGRTRQTQTRGSLDQTDPNGPVDRIITGDAMIDGRGLTLQAWAPYASFGKLGELAPAASRPPGPSTQTTYDALGRPDLSAMISYYATSPDPATGSVDPALVSDTDYDGLTTTVNPPGGQSAATSTTLDALGRTKIVTEYDSDSAVSGVNAATTYTYTLRGEVDTITDQMGNVTDYGYDRAGRRTTVHDPNDNPGPLINATTISYDLNGNVESTVDARGINVRMTYDELDRETARYAGTPERVQSEMFYDEYPSYRGFLTTATAWVGADPARQYRFYDLVGRPTSISLYPPYADGGSGLRQQTAIYDLAGHQTVLKHAEDPESVVTTFDALGRATTMITNRTGGPATLVEGTVYATTGPVPGAMVSQTYGTAAGAPVSRTVEYDGYGRLRGSTTSQPGGGATALAQRYRYNAEGLTSSITESSAGQAECFTYDRRNRLTHAFTASSASSCTTPDLTAPDRYDDTFSYDPLNRLTSVDGVARTWNPSRPHAIADTNTGTSYTYTDADGRADQRATAAGTQTLTWNDLGLLEAVSGPNCPPGGGCTDGNAYMPNGQRILQTRRDSSMTLYVGADELEYPATPPPQTLVTYDSPRTSAAPQTVAMGPVNLPANSLIIVSVARKNIGTTTLTDSTGATWTRVNARAASPSPNQIAHLFYRRTTTAQTGVTIRLDAGTNPAGAWSAHVASIAGATGSSEGYASTVNPPAGYYGRRYSMLVTAGTPTAVTPASTEHYELYESSVGSPKLQIEDGVGARDPRTISPSQTSKQINFLVVSSSPTVRRTYTFAGQVIGVRTPTGYHLTLTDPQGTATLTVNPAGQTTIRRFTPYGSPREPTPPTWPTNNGFLNKPADQTGLTLLGARYYDPTTMNFLGIDPLVQTTRTPYLYANGNPVAFSDPSGLCAPNPGCVLEADAQHEPSWPRMPPRQPMGPPAPSARPTSSDDISRGLESGELSYMPVQAVDSGFIAQTVRSSTSERLDNLNVVDPDLVAIFEEWLPDYLAIDFAVSIQIIALTGVVDTAFHEPTGRAPGGQFEHDIRPISRTSGEFVLVIVSRSQSTGLSITPGDTGDGAVGGIDVFSYSEGSTERYGVIALPGRTTTTFYNDGQGPPPEMWDQDPILIKPTNAYTGAVPLACKANRNC